MSASQRSDVYARVTQAIVDAIEAGTGTWRMPWHHSGADVTRPTNVASGKPYRGINSVSLWAAAYGSGYTSGVWGTYRQWQALGAQVRKGEVGIGVSFIFGFENERITNKFPVQSVAPCEGTSYEIGGIALVKGARNKEAARRYYDWLMSPGQETAMTGRWS